LKNKEFKFENPAQSMMQVQNICIGSIILNFFTFILLWGKKMEKEMDIQEEKIKCSKFHFVDLAGSER